MSASLVGSEMCIRDRRSPSQGRKGVAAWSGGVWVCCGVGQGVVRSAATVSYTHLTLPTICSV
eukprot:7538518-Alexandrium_andersonii.AAC.1